MTLRLLTTIASGLGNVFYRYTYYLYFRGRVSPEIFS